MPLNLNEDSKKPQQSQSKSQPQPSNTIDSVKEQTKLVAEQASTQLHDAGLHTADKAFERLEQKRQLDVNQIAQRAELLIDPELKWVDGFLLAVQRVAERHPELLKGLDTPFGGYFSDSMHRELPSVPSFSNWQSTQEQSSSPSQPQPTLLASAEVADQKPATQS